MATFTPDTTNILFQLAADLVNQSSRNLFLTGKAGTGKTTFLKYIRENCPKEMAVVAPTGVAAINAGGVTIHSFFQLPLSPFIPASKGFSKDESTVDRHQLIGRIRFNNEKIKVIRQLELLVIDEISMVRCDIMDAIDTVLRHFRKRPYEPFGGVQLLLIGDMFQLPPVVRDPEWNLLSGFYGGPYFFDSHIIKANPPLYIEFDKIYRQSEEKFIKVLNQVRNNLLDNEGLQVLESRFQTVIRRTDNDGYIILTTHNEQAKNTNLQALQRLTTPAFKYQAKITDDFPENAYPADEVLVLKEGAQVMFIRNDTGERGRRYFNGKIGVVSRLEQDRVFVKCEDEPEMEVIREEWENIRYSLDKTSQQLKENVLGTFSQFPLRLAWAITIHKSQGLTFDKLIIDAGEAFAPGQVYVALSRCTSLDGLILKSKLRPNSILTDPRVISFSKNIASSEKLQQELLESRKQYQQKLLLSAFDLEKIRQGYKEIWGYMQENASSFNSVETIQWLEAWKEKLDSLRDTSVKFQKWLKEQFALNDAEELNSIIQERVCKAAAHFTNEITDLIAELQKSPAVTDSRICAKEYTEALSALFNGLSSMNWMLEELVNGFSIEAWHGRKRSFVLPSFNVNPYAGQRESSPTSKHAELYRELKRLRDSICQERDVPIYYVAGSHTLNEMCNYLPLDKTSLRKINGFGDAKVEKYGQQFLDIIIEYCKENNMESLMHEIPEKNGKRQRYGRPIRKGDTYSESFRLFAEGKSIPEIATARNLAVSTIEGHLTRFVRSGEIKVEDVVPPEKRMRIEAALAANTENSITPVKQKLGDDISYADIRFVMAGRDPAKESSTD